MTEKPLGLAGNRFVNELASLRTVRATAQAVDSGAPKRGALAIVALSLTSVTCNIGA